MKAVGVALLFILSSLFVIVNSDIDGETSNVQHPCIDDIKGKDTYWIRADIVGEDLVLSRTTSTNYESVSLTVDQTKLEWKNIIFKSGFIIPNEAGIQIVEYDVYFTDLTVYGTIGAQIPEKMLKSADNATKLDFICENGKDFQLKGVSMDIDCTMRIIVKEDGQDDKVMFSTNGHFLAKGLDVSNDHIVANGLVLIDGIMSMAYDYKVELHEITFENELTISSGRPPETSRTDLQVIYGDSQQPNWIFGIFCNFDGSISFKENSKELNDENRITMTGNFFDGSVRYERCATTEDPDFYLTDLSLKNMTVDLGGMADGTIFVENKEGIADYTDGVIFILPEYMMSTGAIKSTSDEPIVVCMKWNVPEDPETHYFERAVDNEGKILYMLTFTPNTGVKLDKTSAFVAENKSINLNDIKVTCESGYQFLGWYYLDVNDGTLKPVSDPTSFTPTDNMVLYALGAPGSGPTPTPATTPELNMGLIVGMSIALIVLAVGCAYLLVTRY